MENETKEPRTRKRSEPARDEANQEMQHQEAGFDPSQALETVTSFAKENPHIALAAALGVGFLLGGGLTPRMLGAAALFASKRYFGQTLKDTVEGALGARLGED